MARLAIEHRATYTTATLIFRLFKVNSMDLIQEHIANLSESINKKISEIERNITNKVLSKFSASEITHNIRPTQNGFSISELVLTKDNTQLVVFKHKIKSNQLTPLSSGYQQNIEFVYSVEYNKDIFG